IATAADLIALGKTPSDYDKQFIMTADIDLDPNLPEGKVFDRAVIGSFSGIFNGNGHTISNLAIIGDAYLGLFGRLTPEAYVKNLGVVDVNIVGLDGRAGGLVGFNDGGSVLSSYSTGLVHGIFSIGGLVGDNDGSITSSYSRSTVSGDQKYVGGLVGRHSGSITASYSMGRVSGDGYVGGLVGRHSGSITASYSMGTVSGNGFVGGLVGWNRNSGGVFTSFWDVESSGLLGSDGGTGLTTAEMKTATTFLEAGWDFIDETDNGTEDIWKMRDGYDCPRLAWEPGPDASLVFVNVDEPNFSGEMSKYETTNAQFCQYLNAVLAEGLIHVVDGIVYAVSDVNQADPYYDTRNDPNDYAFSQIKYQDEHFDVLIRDGYSMANHPVVMVSLHGATAFSDYFGCRLPTLREWKAVADYDGSYIYGSGTSIDHDNANYAEGFLWPLWYGNPLGLTSYPYTSPVGYYPAHGYGLCDLAGNVAERTTSVSFDGYCISLGGSWSMLDMFCTVPSSRTLGSPQDMSRDVGFRVCR
ncbi:MAG: formylglycine-generating enzyme family protein, partial [Planctomycetes bacterium]|nr:formylglycine-generating enzyme family protein [Planctomycetota bacterium]